MLFKPSFDEIFMNLAINLAKKSHCVKKQVGAVLTKDTRIISIGYNGPPAKTYNCDEEWPQDGCKRDHRGGCSLAIHAEQNAILYAIKNKVDIEGGCLYVTLSPCLACARLILSSGIQKVIYLNAYATYKKDILDEGIFFLQRFNVTIRQYFTK